MIIAVRKAIWLASVSTLLLTVVNASQAFATEDTNTAAEPATNEAPCLRAYRQGHDEYVKKIKDEEENYNTGKNLSIAGALSFGACLVVKRSAACVTLLGFEAVGIPTAVLADERIRKLENEMRVYDLYQNVRQKEFGQANVQELYHDEGIPQTLEPIVNQEVLRLMDSGELCEKNEASVTYAELSIKLRNKTLER